MTAVTRRCPQAVFEYGQVRDLSLSSLDKELFFFVVSFEPPFSTRDKTRALHHILHWASFFFLFFKYDWRRFFVFVYLPDVRGTLLPNLLVKEKKSGICRCLCARKQGAGMGIPQLPRNVGVTWIIRKRFGYWSDLEEKKQCLFPMNAAASRKLPEVSRFKTK